MLNFKAAPRMAFSVGEPINFQSSVGSSGFSITASLQRTVYVINSFKFSGKTSSLYSFCLVKSNSSSSVKMRSTRMVPSVKVPVLSTQMIEVLPNVSADTNFLTNAFFCKILCMPIIKITVMATNNPSGIAETETATATKKISQKSLLCKTPITIIAKAKSNTAKPSFLLKPDRLFCKGVCSSFVSLIRSAIFPISVSIPVPTTIARPRPSTTKLPLKTMFFCSATKIFFSLSLDSSSTFFTIEEDSPVNKASLVWKLFISNNLASAGT